MASWFASSRLRGEVPLVAAMLRRVFRGLLLKNGDVTLFGLK
jgi:hypothetical protein